MAKKEKKPKLKLKKKDEDVVSSSIADSGDGEDKKKGSPKYEVNFNDGFDHHDVIGFLLIPLRIIWAFLKIIFFPVIWVARENEKMIRFWFATSHETPLTRNERDFVESLPLLYTITGLVAGVFFGVVAAFGFGDELRRWINELNFVDGLFVVLNFIGSILKFLLEVLLAIFDGIGWFFGLIINSVGTILQENPFGALLALIAIIVVGTMIVIAIKETGVLDFIGKWLRKIYGAILGTPGALKNRIVTSYRRFNSFYAKLLYTEDRLNTRTQVYFKNVIGFTFLVSILIFLSGIYVSFTYYSQSSNTFETISFFAFVLFVTGLVSGWCLGLFGWYLDLLNRSKYIAESAKGSDPEEIIEEKTSDAKEE